MSKKLLVIGIFCLLLAGLSTAQTNIGFNGIGPMIGYVSPENIDGTIAFGARADLGSISKFGFMADVLFWSKGQKETSVYYSYEYSYSSFYVTALGKYSFGDPNAQLRPYTAAGLGFCFSKVSADEHYMVVKSLPSATSPMSLSDSNTDLCIHLIGGVDYQLSPQLTGFAEFRYMLGGWDTWGIFAGAIYNLSK